MQQLAPIVNVPRRFWEREYGACPLPKGVTVVFEVAGQPVEECSAHGFVSVAEDSELRLSGLWAVAQDRLPGHLVAGWDKVDENTIKLLLQPPDADLGGNEEAPAADRKRPAPAGLPEPQAKLPALGSGPVATWEPPAPQQELAMVDWRQGSTGGPPAGTPVPVVVAPASQGEPPRLQPGRRRGGGRVRGGSRGTTTGRGCAKLVRTTTRLYIGVGQVREWLGEVGPRTELQVKVMLDNRMLFGMHQADLLYNRGAHYYWITSRTLKRTAMGKWFLGWSHTPSDGLVLLLRSPSKDEIAAAIAEGFQGREEEEDAEASEQNLSQQSPPQSQQPAPSQPLALSQHAVLAQQSALQLLRAGRVQQARGPAGVGYGDDEAEQQQQQQLAEEAGSGGPRQLPGRPAGGLPAGEEEDVVSGVSADEGLRRNLPPSDPRLMVALAAQELQRGIYGSAAQGGGHGERRPAVVYQSGGAAGRAFVVGREAAQAAQQQQQQQPQQGLKVQQGHAVPQLTHALSGVSASQLQLPRPLSAPGSEALLLTTGGAVAVAVARSPGVVPARQTNFAEVPGGTAFASLALPSEAMGPDPAQMASAPPPPPPRTVPSGLGTATSIASNITRAGTTQLTNTASLLQASGVAGPIMAPLLLPASVSELLPPEYLPAAVSVRCTVDGALQAEVFACEIHRSRQGLCYLYNLPATILQDRTQQDWMISEDGCLVLCLKSAPPQQLALVENKSVRSNPTSNPAKTVVGAGGAPQAARGTNVSRVQPAPSAATDVRAQRSLPDPDVPSAEARGTPPLEHSRSTAAPSVTAAERQLREPSAPSVHAHAAEAGLATGGGGGGGGGDAEPGRRPAGGGVQEGRADAGAEPQVPPHLAVPRQVLESLYGNLVLPQPVLLQLQYNEELAPQVYLAEASQAGGELVLRGVPADVMVGRAVAGWRRANVLSHQLLVACLEGRPEQRDAGAGQVTAVALVPPPAAQARDDVHKRARPDAPSHAPSLPSAGQPSRSSGLLPTRGVGSADVAAPSARAHAFGSSGATPFGSSGASLSGTLAAPGSGQHSHCASLQLQQTVTGPGQGAGGGAQQAQHGVQPPLVLGGDSGGQHGMPPPPPLQPVFSTGPLPIVGSSKLTPTPSQPLGAPASGMLAAQASTGFLAPAASVRAEAPAGGGSGAGAGAGAGRQPAASPRGAGAAPAAAAAPAPAMRAPLNLDSPSGPLLQVGAGREQAAAAQAPTPRATPARPGPRAAVFPWQPEAGAHALAAPSVFAHQGLGPSSALESSSMGPAAAQPPPAAARLKQQGGGAGTGNRDGAGAGAGLLAAATVTSVNMEAAARQRRSNEIPPAEPAAEAGVPQQAAAAAAGAVEQPGEGGEGSGVSLQLGGRPTAAERGPQREPPAFQAQPAGLARPAPMPTLDLSAAQGYSAPQQHQQQLGRARAWPGLDLAEQTEDMGAASPTLGQPGQRQSSSRGAAQPLQPPPAVAGAGAAFADGTHYSTNDGGAADSAGPGAAGPPLHPPGALHEAQRAVAASYDTEPAGMPKPDAAQAADGQQGEARTLVHAPQLAAESERAGAREEVEEPLPPRRAVLRMLSAVEREPEDA